MPAPEPPPPPPLAGLHRGLSRREEELAAGEFFSRVPWDEPLADPDMPAGEFLDAVGSEKY